MARKRKFSWGERLFSFLATVLCICAVALVLALVIEQKFLKKEDPTVQSVSVPASSAATPEPMTLRLPTATPGNAETAQTPPPVRNEAAAEAEYDFLPVYTKAETNERVIAITLDDCSHQMYVKYAAMAAVEHNAKLTLFPIGKSVMDEGMSDILRTCVNSMGFQVENRTWSDALLYRMSDADMAMEIWAADVAVDYALASEYEMHFFRMRSGSGAKDVRTHSYLKQLGYDAIVNWTVSSVEKDIDALQNSLSPGNIYQFTSSREDVEKLIAFIDIADRHGYRMVTLNELLGYPANNRTAVEDVNAILSQTMPLLENYTPVYVPHQIGDRAWQVYLIQDRLCALGYLPAGSADGIYGSSTSSAVSKFQAAAGLIGTGVANTATQQSLFSSDAPAFSGPTPTPIPTATPAA